MGVGGGVTCVDLGWLVGRGEGTKNDAWSRSPTPANHVPAFAPPLSGVDDIKGGGGPIAASSSSLCVSVVVALLSLSSPLMLLALSSAR